MITFISAYFFDYGCQLICCKPLPWK